MKSGKTLGYRLASSQWRFRAWTFVVFALGIVLIAVQSCIPVEVLKEVSRDLGIAFVTAGAVTLIYERYARERAAAESVDDVLAKIIGDVVDERLWRELRDQILSKDAIRRNMSVRLWLEPDAGLLAGQYCLRVSMDYQLASLRSYPHDLKVLHFCDSYMGVPTARLPHFTRFEVGGKAKAVNGSRVEELVHLGGRDAIPIPVVLEREEIVYVPGAYSLIMSESTELTAISLWAVPPDVKVEVNILFDEQELTTSSAVSSNRLLLPGQCAEIRFIRKTAPEHALAAGEAKTVRPS